VKRSNEKVPVVVLHGGPGVPSNYLLPLADHSDRSLLFYDQLGCGQSDRPDNEDLYSIDLFLNDFVQLLDEFAFDGGFHLYGQSFGGILAFEYLKRERPENCLSVTLSSTPTSVPQVEAEANRLMQTLIMDAGGEEDNMEEAFRKAHQCQTPVKPQPLIDAYALAGTIFHGTQAIPDYQATLEDDDSERVDVPALIMRGEKDFVTPDCVKGWDGLFGECKIVELEGCAHHGLLEQPDLYAKTLESFWKRHEQG
jgi:L-proline amide hydrolase